MTTTASPDFQLLEVDRGYCFGFIAWLKESSVLIDEFEFHRFTMGCMIFVSTIFLLYLDMSKTGFIARQGFDREKDRLIRDAEILMTLVRLMARSFPSLRGHLKYVAVARGRGKYIFTGYAEGGGQILERDSREWEKIFETSGEGLSKTGGVAAARKSADRLTPG